MFRTNHGRSEAMQQLRSAGMSRDGPLDDDDYTADVEEVWRNFTDEDDATELCRLSSPQNEEEEEEWKDQDEAGERNEVVASSFKKEYLLKRILSSTHMQASGDDEMREEGTTYTQDASPVGRRCNFGGSPVHTHAATTGGTPLDVDDGVSFDEPAHIENDTSTPLSKEPADFKVNATTQVFSAANALLTPRVVRAQQMSAAPKLPRVELQVSAQTYVQVRPNAQGRLCLHRVTEVSSLRCTGPCTAGMSVCSPPCAPNTDDPLTV
ncbi:hypothetical protein DQ04_00191180 [Trypanosoma grayi]|uniref:hypothetical protein n=1 Tax=Trypanosoma grayi TaxID=71804 RepID=UPI0004F447CD|nr:hypothetical protein DQ04_00191180 [Trypanosoma grayi]KEG15094.1 hypothetical protein DQ04_00191180 [Trypanosoma grayi]